MSLRRGRASLLASCVLALVGSCARGGMRHRVPTLRLTPQDNLQWILDTLRGPARVVLADGDYQIDSVPFTDSTCTGCADSGRVVSATRGLLVRGRGIRLVGGSAEGVVIHTHAGYGIYFDGCEGCGLRAVTITGGIRDRDPHATDAGVVVRRGEVDLEGCVVRDNLGDSALVDSLAVGVAGVAVRDGGTANVQLCRIEHNSWDGVVLYGSAHGRIFDNVVNGVGAAASGSGGEGRGVGIALTRDARALVEGNLVTRYRTGIGVFSNAQAEIRENIVEDVRGWGLADRGGAGERPVAIMTGNAVFATGACGALIDRVDTTPAPLDAPPRESNLEGLAAADPGRLVGNLFVATDQNPRYDSGKPYCTPRPIAREHVPKKFIIANNLLYAVRQPGRAPVEDTLDAAAFRAAADSTIQELETHPMLRASRFLGAFGGTGS